MKVIMLMFDTLSRRYLPNYGCDWTKMPNFLRLAEKTVTYDNFYAGSLPCMPARREIHTGRYNFLHRGWSPLEPFDDSMPEILKKSGVYTHLVSDHQHYWEDGGATYHNRYNSYEFIRGQEGDLWKGMVNDPDDIPEELAKFPSIIKQMKRQDLINRKYMEKEEDHTQYRTFSAGLEFLETNKEADNWFLQLEYFDPHEPFFVPDRFKKMYEDHFNEEFDWPPYAPSTDDSPEKIQHAKNRYAALTTMCDYYLGRILDFMDENHMWKDTMLMVNTDHGFLMGEKEWWGKSVMPIYNEIAHTPFFLWDPRLNIKGERRQSLCQTIDIAPTILEFFGKDIPKDMEGKPLKTVMIDDTPIRQYGLFGYHGGHINITDGDMVYMRSCHTFGNSPLYEYTLMPMDMRAMKTTSTLKEATLHTGFEFTKDIPVLKIKPRPFTFNPYLSGHKLFDLKADSHQENPIDDLASEKRFADAMVKLMRQNEAPDEQYSRIGLPKEGNVSIEKLQEDRLNRIKKEEELIHSLGIKVDEDAKDAFISIAANVPVEVLPVFTQKFIGFLQQANIHLLNKEHVILFLQHSMPPEMGAFAALFFKASTRRY